MKRLKIAINGLGAIGRMLLRLLIDDSRFQIVAINDPASHHNLINLLNRSLQNHNWSRNQFKYEKNILYYQKQTITCLQFQRPIDCKWDQFDCDLVIEASGRFTSYNDLQQHLQAGAKQVFLTTNFHDPIWATKTVIYNFNHSEIDLNQPILSLGSCTSHCLLLTLKTLQKTLKFQTVNATSIHAMTNQQALFDRLNNHYVTSRSILNNILPATTNANKIIHTLMPNLKIAINALRVPVSIGSLLQLNLILQTPIELTTFHHQLSQLQTASFQVNNSNLSAIDIVGNSAAAIFDPKLTVKNGNLLQIGIWYDNEFGYVSQIYRFLVFFVNSKIN